MKTLTQACTPRKSHDLARRVTILKLTDFPRWKVAASGFFEHPVSALSDREKEEIMPDDLVYARVEQERWGSGQQRRKTS